MPAAYTYTPSQEDADRARRVEMGMAATYDAGKQQAIAGANYGLQALQGQQVLQQQAQRGNIQSGLAAQQAGYQSQQMGQQAANQWNSAEQAAGHQGVRDQRLIGAQQQMAQFQAQQEQEQQAQRIQGQIDIQNNQLTQTEILRLNRLKAAKASVDDHVQNGTLTQDEGAQMRLQLESGIDPLQRRLVQSQISNENQRTQALQQQTTQGAQEFNRRQAILNQSAQDRMHMFQDPVTGVQSTMQLLPDGSYAPMEMGIHAQEHIARMHQIGENIQTSQQARLESQQMLPIRIEHGNLSNTQLALATSRATDMHPLHMQSLATEIAGRIQQYEMNGQRAPVELETAQARLDALRQGTTQAAELHPERLGALQHENSEPVRQAALDYRTAQTDLANAHAEDIRGRNDEDTVAAQQEYQRAQTRLANSHALNYERQANGGQTILTPAQRSRLMTTLHGQVTAEVTAARNPRRQPNGQPGVPTMPQWWVPGNYANHPTPNVAAVDDEVMRRFQQRINELSPQGTSTAPPQAGTAQFMIGNRGNNPGGGMTGGASPGGVQTAPSPAAAAPNANPQTAAHEQAALEQMLGGIGRPGARPSGPLGGGATQQGGAASSGPRSAMTTEGTARLRDDVVSAYNSLPYGNRLQQEGSALGQLADMLLGTQGRPLNASEIVRYQNISRRIPANLRDRLRLPTE